MHKFGKLNTTLLVFIDLIKCLQQNQNVAVPMKSMHMQLWRNIRENVANC